MSLILKTNIEKSTYSITDSFNAMALRKNKTPNYRYMMHRLAGFAPEEYTDMEYDLSEHARIIDTEAIVASIFKKKRQMILKNGFQLNSKSDRNLKYIKKRLDELEYVSSQSFKDFIAEVAENLVNFNNTFILKYRKEDRSTGLVREEDGKELNPIAGLYVLASPTIDTATHPKSGQIIKYRHRITDLYSRQFRPVDIYHIYENKRVGITIGTPSTEAVKDDIFLLRSIEQSTESLINRHANPLMHIQVGSDKSPARMLGDGISEVDLYADIIDKLPEEGGVATPHRVTVKYLGAESQALRLEEYLKYFKQRVFIGLGASEVDLGSGTGVSGGSAEVVSKPLKDDVRSYQSTIETYISNYVFNELLLESPMYKGKQWIPQEERVVLSFIEPDLDKRIKIESHYLQLYQSGLITKEAAIKRMEFDVEDINHEELLPNSNTNAVRNSISNNIIAPKNQHNIKDSLVLDVEKPIDDFYNTDYKIFLKNLSTWFGEDTVKENKRRISNMYKQLDGIIKVHGLNTANIFVNKVMLDLIP